MAGLCGNAPHYVYYISRALNTHGKWRIIVNEIPASYDKLTQTVRIEKCKYHEAACPKLPGKERGLPYKTST